LGDAGKDGKKQGGEIGEGLGRKVNAGSDNGEGDSTAAYVTMLLACNFELLMAGSVKREEAVSVKHLSVAGNDGEAMMAPTMTMAQNSSAVSM
jgi:hypothetical protein